MAGEPPPVPTIPPYIDPAGFSTEDLPNTGYRVFLPLVIMIVLSGLTVAGRLATRISAKQLGADDYTITLALLSCLIQTTFWAKSVQTGYGADYLLLTQPQRMDFNKWWFFGNIFYPITLALFKTSVILLSKRIFVQKAFQRICWATLIVNGCWALGNILSTIFQCVPIPMMWGAVTEGSCWGQNALWISIVTWDVSSDVWIMGMTVPMIWKLQLRFKERMIVLVFSILSCSAVADSLNTQADEENTYTFATANLFQVLESNMGIIGACLPVLRAPLKRILPKVFGSKFTNPGYYYSNDRFQDQYALRNVNASQRKDAHWNRTSVSGPDLLRHDQRESDELEIMGKDGECDKGSAASSEGTSSSGIRKKTTVTVDRMRV